MTVAGALNCAAFVPEHYRTPVEGADLPVDGTVGAWVAFGDAQTGKLEIANDRTASTIAILDACEAQERAVAEGLGPRPWWRFWG